MTTVDSSIVRNRTLLDPLWDSMYNWSHHSITSQIEKFFAADAVVQLAYPFEDLDGGAGWYAQALGPLALAWPDIERRNTIVTSGVTEIGDYWVGCCGYYTGTFVEPFLKIPPTQRQAAMRFHEFFRIVDSQIVEVQALWDIPEVMMQANAWPMGPSLGRAWHAPAPATQDGLKTDRTEARSAESLGVVRSMLTDMGKHPTEPPEAMNLERYWHPKFSWYGPAGIGTSRGVQGFREIHQIPFLKAMPDRAGGTNAEDTHFWGDGDYVSVTGWPDMNMTVTGDGWLGIVPPNKKITMRSLDFWRVEESLIRENWVLVDLLHVWNQLGVDVLSRMEELAPRGHGY